MKLAIYIEGSMLRTFKCSFRLYTAACCLLLGLAAGPSSSAADFYAEADLAYISIPIAGRDFSGFGAKLRVGAQLYRGFGAEVQTLGGFGEDNVDTLELSLDNTTAVFLRYDTPEEADFQFFVLAGYATTSLSFSGAGTAELEDKFDGFAWGLGAQEKLKIWPGATAVLEVNSYFGDSNVDVWALSMGVRYDF